MDTVTTIDDLRARLDAVRAGGGSVGFVPTMGYLHEGHVELMRAAVRDCDHVVVSIFVNPLQFAAHEDLEDYPRDLRADSRQSADAGVATLFVPSGEEMYPVEPLTEVTVASITEEMEGRFRPTHFAGVATVVTKLFSIVGPCRAYFGEKDFQQLALVRRLVLDLSMPVEVVGCPTVREADGLAMSSRNVYLDADQRAAAPVLRRALLEGAARISAGERDADEIRRVMTAVIAEEPLGQLDYVEVADPLTLAPLEVCDTSARLLGCVRFGTTRLLDNVAAADGDGESR